MYKVFNSDEPITNDEMIPIICEKLNIPDIRYFSDGYHTFDSLYNQRLFLTAALVNAYKDKAWKTKYHEDGEPCFGGDWFLVTIDTPAGAYGYHYRMQYWDMFDCKEIPKAKHWDGYTDEDVDRLLSLNPEER